MSRFITFEGVDGAGKSVQVHILAGNLTAAGILTQTTWEPGGTTLAQNIRKSLLAGHYKESGPDAEAVMFAAARIDHVRCVILPSLAAGRWVICDRFIDSTRVYQGLAGATPGLLALLEATASPRRPDLTFVLDVDPETAAKRLSSKNLSLDRYELDGFGVLAERRKRFLEIAHAEPDRCVVIDASGQREDVGDRIFEVVRRNFLPN